MAPNMIFKRLRDAGARRDPVQPPARRAWRASPRSASSTTSAATAARTTSTRPARRRRLPGNPGEPQNCTCVGYQTDRPHHPGAERRAARRRRHGQLGRREPRRHPQHRLRRDGDRQRHQPERLPRGCAPTGSRCSPRRTRRRRAGRCRSSGERRLRLPPHQHRGGRLHANLRVRQRRRPCSARRDGLRREHPRRAHDGHDGALHRDDPRGRGRAHGRDWRDLPPDGLAPHAPGAGPGQQLDPAGGGARGRERRRAGGPRLRRDHDAGGEAGAEEAALEEQEGRRALRRRDPPAGLGGRLLRAGRGRRRRSTRSRAPTPSPA